MTEPALSHLDDGYSVGLHDACATFIALCTAGHPEPGGTQSRAGRIRDVFDHIFPEYERDRARALIAELLAQRDGGQPWEPPMSLPS